MIRIIIMILTILLLLLPGCSFFGKKNPPAQPKTPPKPAEQKEPSKEAQKQYFVGLDAPVEGIKNWVEQYKAYEVVLMQKKGDYRLLLISMGEKFVPGYSLKLEKVDKQDNKWLVLVSFKEEEAPPDDGQKTYIPWEVLSIPADGKPVEVLRVTSPTDSTPMEVVEIPEGEKLPASKSFIIFRPMAGEEVDDPVIIKGKARVFEANFRIIIKEGTKHLADKVVMAGEGAPGWGEFELDLSFEKPVTPDIMLVFAYENMENGEMIQELIIPLKFKER